MTRRRPAVGVTGIPGCGKKSISPLLATELDMRVLDLNAAVRLHAEGVAESDEAGLEVDVDALRSRLLGRDLSGTVVFGHLLPDVFVRDDFEIVVVLRCRPDTLKGRLRSRGYATTKIISNLEAELIGVALDASLRVFGPDKVREYDTTSAVPTALALRIAAEYRDGTTQAGPWIDWTLDYDSSTKLRSLLSPVGTDPAST